MDLRAYKFISSISRFFFSTDQKFIILFLFNHLIYYCASLCLFFVQRKIFACRCCCLMLETAFTALTLLLLVHLSSRNRHRNVGIRTCISTCGRLFFFHVFRKIVYIFLWFHWLFLLKKFKLPFFAQRNHRPCNSRIVNFFVKCC